MNHPASKKKIPANETANLLNELLPSIYPKAKLAGIQLMMEQYTVDNKFVSLEGRIGFLSNNPLLSEEKYDTTVADMMEIQKLIDERYKDLTSDLTKDVAELPDAELNEIEQFYKMKDEELINHAEILKTRLRIIKNIRHEHLVTRVGESIEFLKTYRSKFCDTGRGTIGSFVKKRRLGGHPDETSNKFTNTPSRHEITPGSLMINGSDEFM